LSLLAFPIVLPHFVTDSFSELNVQARDLAQRLVHFRRYRKVR
jgi:hypothetical protein